MQVAEGQQGIGLTDEAVATRKLAVSNAVDEPDKDIRVISLKKVAATQARLGFSTEAQATVDRIDEPDKKSWAWYGIVEAEVEAGRLGEAYRVAGLVRGKAIPNTWMAFAAAEVRGHRLSEARKALEKAEDAVNKINAGFGVDIIIMFAELRAAIGD